MDEKFVLDKQRVMRIIKAALKEDLGRGDITTNFLIPKFNRIKAIIKANEDCVLCGITIAEWVLNSVDYSVRFKPMCAEGMLVREGEEVALVEGNARAVLTAERLMLNFLSILSSVATQTNEYVKIVEKYGVKILDTRKTIPLLRYLEKYAVNVGGGTNHRMDLGEMMLIKDNHIMISGSMLDIISLRKKIGKDTKIEVEVDNLKELKNVLKGKPDIIMLDNMGPDLIKRAIELRAESPDYAGIKFEASGGITLNNIEAYAKTGVDMISIGALTDTIRGIDFSLDVV